MSAKGERGSKQYEVSSINYGSRRESMPPRYTENLDSIAPNSFLTKPIVIPQKTNIFMIKTFSPFARAYSPALAQLPNPIPKEEFLAFIDNLNQAFLSSPVFQAAHVVGGTLLGTQILPAQAVGGVFQVVSVLGSAGVSLVRVKRYVKKANTNIFAPRGLIMRIMSTKKMMAEVGYQDADGKGKLVLPPLEELTDLTPQTEATIHRQPTGSSGHSRTGSNVEDPRMRRLRALGDKIAPLELESAPAPVRGAYEKYGGAPLRWMNKRADAKFAKAADKSASARLENAPEAESIIEQAERELDDIAYRIAEVQQNRLNKMNRHPDVETRGKIEAEMELAGLEEARKKVLSERDEKLKEIYKKGDKKLEKLAAKEEKVANRILWIVISRRDGKTDSAGGEELLVVDDGDDEHSERSSGSRG